MKHLPLEDIRIWREAVDNTPESPSPIGGPEFSSTMEMAIGKTILIKTEHLLMPLFESREKVLGFLNCDSYNSIRFNGILGKYNNSSQLDEILNRLPRKSFIHISIPKAIQSKNQDVFNKHGFKAIGQYPYYVVDLPDSYEAWFKRPGICRANIRRAIKSDVSIVFGGAEYLDQFYEMYSHSFQRWKDQDRTQVAHRYERFKQIFDVPESKSHIILAKHEEKTIAAAIMIAYKNIAATVNSGINYEYQKIRPTNLIHAEIIKYLISKKIYRYHLGGEIGGEKLGQFKKSLGAKKYTSIVLVRHRYPKLSKLIPG